MEEFDSKGSAEEIEGKVTQSHHDDEVIEE